MSERKSGYELNVVQDLVPGYGLVRYLITNRGGEKTLLQNSLYTLNQAGLSLYNGVVAKLFLDEFSRDIGRSFSFLEKMFS